MHRHKHTHLFYALIAILLSSIFLAVQQQQRKHWSCHHSSIDRLIILSPFICSIVEGVALEIIVCWYELSLEFHLAVWAQAFCLSLQIQELWPLIFINKTFKIGQSYKINIGEQGWICPAEQTAFYLALNSTPHLNTLPFSLSKEEKTRKKTNPNSYSIF